VRERGVRLYLVLGVLEDFIRSIDEFLGLVLELICELVQLLFHERRLLVLGAVAQVRRELVGPSGGL
jgi:hypothetical protein